MDCGDDAFGAPDGAACGNMHKKTKLANDPSLSNEEEEEDWQGEDDDEEWETSEDDPVPDMDSGSDDDISVPGLTEDDDLDKEKQKKAKLLKTSKQRNEQRSKSQPPRTRIKEADAITLNSVPNAPGFKAWWNNLCTIMSASSSYPDKAFAWVRKVKRDSDYKTFNDPEGFDSLDIKFAVALQKILPNV